MKALIYTIAAAVVLTAGFFFLNAYIYAEKQGEENLSYEPYRATLSGEYVCLPHSTTGDFETKECIFGIKTDAEEYYGIDFGLMSQTPPELRVGERFSANGVVTPIERLSTDFWQKYAVEGIFSVTDGVISESGVERVSVGFGEMKSALGVTIEPKELVSDSRCPVEVQCIWAGTVEVRTVLSGDVSHGEHVLTLGTPQVFGAHEVTLVQVLPVKTQEAIPQNLYVFVFEVSRK